MWLESINNKQEQIIPFVHIYNNHNPSYFRILSFNHALLLTKTGQHYDLNITRVFVTTS